METKTRRKFATANIENFYHFLLKQPPSKSGSSICNEFWAGYNGIKNNRQVPSSFAEAAYWAGEDFRKSKKES